MHQCRVGDVFEFVQPLQRNELERETLLVPYKHSHDLIAEQFYNNADDDEMLTIPSYQPQEDTFMSLLHVALKIMRDLIAQPRHNGFTVDEDTAIKCVP